MHDPAGCNLQMMRNLLIIYEALFNKPNFKRARAGKAKRNEMLKFERVALWLRIGLSC